MKLVVNESIFYDYHGNTEDTIQTVVAEEEGYGALPRLIECFRCSLYDCVRLVADKEDITAHNLNAAAHTIIRNKKIKDCYGYMRYGKVYLKKIGKGVQGGE